MALPIPQLQIPEELENEKQQYCWKAMYFDIYLNECWLVNLAEKGLKIILGRE